MYNQHFGLHYHPFSIAPDPRFLVLGTCHEEALAHLLYGIVESGGFVQLTGEVGTGKTTIVRALLQRLPKNVDVALILNPKLNAEQFVAAILDELGVRYGTQETSLKRLVDILNRVLLRAHARGRKVVVIVDEAQTLDRDVLEQIRLLTNIETDQHKLLQIVLVGQPELREMLARHDLRQLAQRVTARYHLEPISLRETQRYIHFRLFASGAKQWIFSNEAIVRVQKHTRGVPRLINVLCDRALLGAYSHDLATVTAEIVDQAAKEVFAKPQRRIRVPLHLSRKSIVSVLAMGIALVTATLSLRVADSRTLGHSELADVRSHDSLAARISIFEGEGQPPNVVSNAFSSDAEVDEQTGLSAITWRQDASRSSSHRAALSSLFQAWNVELSPTVNDRACEHALTIGLKCMALTGTWAEFRALNWPGIIGVPYQGTIQSIAILSTTSSVAEISIDAHRQRVAAAEIAALWPGQFLILWRPPASGLKRLQVGDQHASVRWIRQTLGTFNGEELRDMSPRFDKHLSEKIKLFQQRRGIAATGVMNSATWIHLSNVGLEIGPRLTSSAVAPQARLPE